YQTLVIWDRPRTRDAQELARTIAGEEFASTLAKEGLALEPFAYGQQGAPFDLTLTIFEIEGALTADFRYNVDLFDASTLARMAQHFLTLLAGIADNPDQHLLALPLLPEAERHTLQVEWNAPDGPYPDTVALHQLIEAQVEKTPQQIALIFEGETRSYRELNREANQLAHQLQKAGVKSDTLVGV